MTSRIDGQLSLLECPEVNALVADIGKARAAARGVSPMRRAVAHFTLNRSGFTSGELLHCVWRLGLSTFVTRYAGHIVAEASR